MRHQTAQDKGPKPARGEASDTAAPRKSAFAALAFGSLGVIYGDIGTSPLYAIRESLAHINEAGADDTAVVGTVSLLVWALFFTVTAKYVLFLLHADNKGEGGTLSLMALANSAIGGRVAAVFFLGVAGAALFSGDAIITPAISVLSALEGLELATPVFSASILPLTIVVVLSLFWAQRRGTARVAAFFSPVIALFFLTMVNQRSLLGDWHW